MRNLIAPYRRQNTASGGISPEVTIISTTCEGALLVGRSRFQARAPVAASQMPPVAAATSAQPAMAAATATSSAATMP